MATICGVDCSECRIKERCKGCAETDGKPFGGKCVVAQCYKKGGEKGFSEYKEQLIREFNELKIQDMPQINELCQLNGFFVNIEYEIPNGQKIKFLEDNNIYLGYQVKKKDSDRCYGLIADDKYLLVCEYDCDGANPEVVVYRKR